LPQDAVQQAGLQLAAAGRDMGDPIAAFDPDMAALTAARNDSDIATPAQSPGNSSAVIQIVLQICVSTDDPRFHTKV
jgi:hypothetical protein